MRRIRNLEDSFGCFVIYLFSIPMFLPCWFNYFHGFNWICEILCILELSYNMTFGQEFIVLYNAFHIQQVFGSCFKVVWRFERRTFYIGPLRVELILGCPKVLIWAWPSMNWNRLPFIQVQTLPPSMHHKWKEIIDIVCKTTNGKSWGTNSWQSSCWIRG